MGTVPSQLAQHLQASVLNCNDIEVLHLKKPQGFLHGAFIRAAALKHGPIRREPSYQSRKVDEQVVTIFHSSLA